MTQEIINGCAIAAFVMVLLVIGWLIYKEYRTYLNGINKRLGGGGVNDIITDVFNESKDFEKLMTIANSDKLITRIEDDLNKNGKAYEYYDELCVKLPWLFIILIYNYKRNRLGAINGSFKSYLAEQINKGNYLGALSIHIGLTGQHSFLPKEEFTAKRPADVLDMLVSFEITNSNFPNVHFRNFIRDNYMNRKGALVDSNGKLV